MQRKRGKGRQRERERERERERLSETVREAKHVDTLQIIWGKKN